MIKRISFTAVLVLPSLAFAQTTAPVRPNHTLPQYGALMAAYSNIGAPRAMLRMALDATVGSYTPLWQPGGIRKDTYVPSLYADGAADMLEQIGRIADGSVQQATVGVASGLAPLDTNNMMLAPVSGDVPDAPAIAGITSAPLTISARFSKYYNIKHFGTILGDATASIDGPVISSFMGNNLSNGETAVQSRAVFIPSGRWPNSGVIPKNTGDTDFVDVMGRLADAPVFAISDHNIGLGVPYFGDCVVSQTHNTALGEKLNFSRVDSNNISKCKYKSSIGIYLVSDTPNQKGSDTNSGNKNLGVTHITTPKHQGYGENLSVKGIHMSMAGSGAQDVDDYVRSIIYGNEWVWAHNTEYNHMIPFSSGDGPSSPEWVYDDSAAGVGKDVSTSSYAPSTSLRKFHWITLNTHVNNDRNTNEDLMWSANKKYYSGQIVVIPSVNNDMFINIAASDGVSGGTEPIWPTDQGASVMDGAVTWKNLGQYTYDFGCIFCIAGGADASHNVRIGTLLTEYGGQIYNSLIDFSEAAWDTNLTTHVFARIQPETYLDLSADGTKAGQNKHLLGYDGTSNALTYKVNGVPVLSVKDSGAVVSSAPSQLPVMTRAQIRAYPSPAKGMEVYDSDDDTPAVYTGEGWKLMRLSALPAN